MLFIFVGLQMYINAIIFITTNQAFQGFQTFEAFHARGSKGQGFQLFVIFRVLSGKIL